MLVLSALFSTFFLSPLLIVLLVAVGVLLVFLRKRRAAVILLTVTGVFVYIFSTSFVSNLLLKPLEYQSPPFSDSSPSVDAIVVLGGGVREGAPDQGGKPSLTAQAEKRLTYGFLLYRRLGVPLFVSGGRPWRARESASEAEVSAGLLAALGVPAARIVTEGASNTTWENARDLAPLLAARNVRRVALVTSAAHMPRARIAFRRAGMEIVPAPTDYLSQSKRWTILDFIPSASALHDGFYALEEYCGIAVYTLRR